MVARHCMLAVTGLNLSTPECYFLPKAITEKQNPTLIFLQLLVAIVCVYTLKSSP